MKLKEILAPTLKPRDIILREDSDATPEQTVEVEDKVAQVKPLVRIVDYVCDQEEMDSINLEIGTTFLPRVNIRVNDPKLRIRETIKSELQLVTVYVGTNKDEYYSKLDYFIEDISDGLGSEAFGISAHMHVPKLYETNIRAFEEKTTFECIKKLCEECELGLMSNMETSSDEQELWIQDGKTNLEMLKLLVSHLYTSDDTVSVMFIDQYAYLNLVDLKKAFENMELEKTSKHPMTGKPLKSTKDVILSTSKFKDEYEEFTATDFSIDINFGETAREIPRKIISSKFDITKKEPEEIESELSFIEEEMLTTINKQLIHNSQLYEQYFSIYSNRPKIIQMFDQTTRICLGMRAPVMLIYPYMHTEVKLYRQSKQVIIDDQESESKTLDGLQKEVPKYDGSDEVLDETLSGNYLVTGIRFGIQTDRISQELILKKQN